MKLKEDEVICPDCNGKGSVPASSMTGVEYKEKCEKCLGSGKLDWVEIIVGKHAGWDFVTFG